MIDRKASTQLATRLWGHMRCDLATGIGGLVCAEISEALLSDLKRQLLFPMRQQLENELNNEIQAKVGADEN
jgi:hypothetical protein